MDDNSKIIFQDFGEKMLDGILDLCKEGSYDSLVQFSFWEKIIMERETYVELLLSKSIEQEQQKYIEILTMIKSNAKYFTADVFTTIFRNYFHNRLEFSRLFNSI